MCGTYTTIPSRQCPRCGMEEGYNLTKASALLYRQEKNIKMNYFFKGIKRYY